MRAGAVGEAPSRRCEHAARGRGADGTPALILSALIESRFEAIVCPHLLDEVTRGLQSRYFSERLEDGRAADIIAGISECSIHFPDAEKPEAVLRDPEDDYLVALAKTAAVDAIVTGDADLLEHPGLQPPAITTRTACEMLGLIQSTETAASSR